MIKLGTNGMSKAYVGSTEVSKVYLGSDLVWENTPVPLPYDTEVEYLKSTGTQYINTNIIGGPTLTYDVCVWADSGDSGFLGSRKDSNSRTCWALITGNFIVQTGYGNSFKNSVNAYSQRWVTLRSYNANSKHNVDINSNGVTETVIVSNVQSFTNTQPVYLFGMNNNGSLVTSFSCVGRIKYCKLYNNGTLVCDLIPVRVGQTGYMYDKVSGELFGNSGSGAFILGNDITV